MEIGDPPTSTKQFISPSLTPTPTPTRSVSEKSKGTETQLDYVVCKLYAC